MDMFLMENTEVKIKETLPEESIEDMMYEDDRFWNMTELTDWNDKFRIELRNSDYEQLREKEDEIEQEAIMLTNVECEDLKKFLVQEAGEKPRVFCKTCSKRKCEDCENLQNRYSEEDRKIYKEVWDNLNLVKEDGKTKVRAKYIYRNPPEETFAPENSNMKTAFSRTNMIIDRLIKKRTNGTILRGNPEEN